jgi:hypothetical protein
MLDIVIPIASICWFEHVIYDLRLLLWMYAQKSSQAIGHVKVLELLWEVN